jgi:hypothetical protein
MEVATESEVADTEGSTATPAPGGPCEMGDCHFGWPVYNGGNPLKGVVGWDHGDPSP